jgi:hypothetical protein
MSQMTSSRSVVVERDPWTSLRAGKIRPVQLPDGATIVALGNVVYPYHDRLLLDSIFEFLDAQRPVLTILSGSIFGEDPFERLLDERASYIHNFQEVPEVIAAREAKQWDDRVSYLLDDCGRFLKSIADASRGQVVYIPSCTHFRMPNEYRMVKYLQGKKKSMDAMTLAFLKKKPTKAQIKELIADSGDPAALEAELNLGELLERGLHSPVVLSDPNRPMPKELDKLLGVHGMDNILILDFGSGVRINNDLLYIVGSFKRRSPGGASMVERKNLDMSVVRAFGGRVYSAWMNIPEHTFPSLVRRHMQFHELGYLWDAQKMANLGDYEWWSPGFWAGKVVCGQVFGRSLYFRRGNNGKRSFVWNGKAYSEREPGCTYAGSEIILPS